MVAAARLSIRRPAAILETNNDITERKRWEQEISALNKELSQRSGQLEASNKELEAFAYSVSHDLRAPLRHMSGFTQLLQKSTASVLNEKSQRYVTIIRGKRRNGWATSSTIFCLSPRIEPRRERTRRSSAWTSLCWKF